MDFKEELISSIKKQLNEPFTLEIPPSLEMGNFSLPCFKLSKKAPELQKLLKLPSFKNRPYEIILSFVRCYLIEKSVAHEPYFARFAE